MLRFDPDGIFGQVRYQRTECTSPSAWRASAPIDIQYTLSGRSLTVDNVASLAYAKEDVVYNCCGLPLRQLYEIVEHIEKAHAISRIGSTSPPNPFNQLEERLYPAAKEANSFPACQPSYSDLNSTLEPWDCDLNDRMRLDVQSLLSFDAMHCDEGHTAVHTPVQASVPEKISGAPGLSLDEPSKQDAMKITPRDETAPSAGRDSPLTAITTSTPSVAPVLDTAGPSSARADGRITIRPQHKPCKAFHCPDVGCRKSYKCDSKLGYHWQRGSCPHAPSTDFQTDTKHASKKQYTTMIDVNPKGIITADEALRPIECAVGICTRRYTHINGLRKHFRRSGEHGVEGFRLIASGEHPSLKLQSRRGREAAQAAAVVSLETIRTRDWQARQSNAV
ncbi:unnamed protein product [Peniophora sp. CBMAI 1063]|nr:unnamed protein product [Peniophora sp. CBMAI 1063]